MLEELTAQENMNLWFMLNRAARRYDKLTGWLTHVPQISALDPAWRQPMDAWLELTELQGDLTADYKPESALVPSGTGWPVGS